MESGTSAIIDDGSGGAGGSWDPPVSFDSGFGSDGGGGGGGGSTYYDEFDDGGNVDYLWLYA